MPNHSSVLVRELRRCAPNAAGSLPSASFMSSLGSLGLPPRRQVGLEVKGRRTGRPHTLAVVIAGHEGEQYLVSMLGECEWVKNVRASGEAHIISGRRRKVRLEEVPIESRAPIIKEYLRLAPGGRPHIGLGTSATLADCQRVAPAHPVFRILYHQNGPIHSHRD